MARKARYRVDRITRGERREIDRIRDAILMHRMEAMKEYAIFQDFVRVNLLEPENLAANMLQYVGVLLSHGLGPGTILSRMQYIEGERRRTSVPGGITLNLIRGFLQQHKAEIGTKRAPDLDTHSIIQLLKAAPSSPERT